MEIKKVIPNGFCKGVIRAINIALKAKEDHPHEKIYVLGMIVHNHFIKEALEQKGIISLDDAKYSRRELIDQLENGVLIFSAHGSDQKLIDRAKNKGLLVIDATCLDVIKTKNLIKEHLTKGYDVIYIGKKGHPECEAILSISSKIHLVSSINDLDDLAIINKKILITNQTTMSIFEIKDIVDSLLVRYPEAIVQDEICQATSQRQKAILKLKDCDLLYIVGDPLSNNTEKLRKIALEAGIKKVRKIQSALELDLSDLKDVEKVYVTAGASTPAYLIDQVFQSLTNYQEKGYLLKEAIDTSKIL